jgi:plastocyanin
MFARTVFVSTGLALVSAALMACGGGGGTTGDDTQHDAPVGDDAPSTDTVHVVDCTAQTADATVTSSNSVFNYDPMTVTIPVNGVVEFDLANASTHPVGPDNSTNTDQGIFAQGGKTTCLQFTAAGTFGYRCTVHGFKGSVTVQ